MKTETQVYMRTNFVVPAWFLRAYEPQEYGQHRFSPMLSPRALDHAPLLLSALQGSFFESQDDSTLKLSLPSLRHQAGAHTQVRKQALEQAVLSWGSLKLAYKSKKTCIFRPLFQTETWTENEIHLEAPVLSTELICGLTDGHRDFARRFSRQPDARSFFGKQAPLIIPRSLWNDLTQSERPLYLRMQAGKSKFDLDGCYTQDIGQLLDQISEGKKLKILGKFLKKLQAHGVITSKPPPPEFYTEKNPGLTLFWQESPRENLEAFSYELTAAYQKQAKYDWLAPMVEPEQVPMISKKIGELYSLLGKTTAKIFRGNILISFVNLYWEWVLRKQYQAPCPLPDICRSLEVFSILPISQASLSQHKLAFEQVLDHLQKDPLLLDMLEDVPQLSLALCEEDLSPAINKSTPKPLKKLQDEDIAEILRELKQSPKIYADLVRRYLATLDEDQSIAIYELQRNLRPEIFERQLEPQLIEFVRTHPKCLEASHGRR